MWQGSEIAGGLGIGQTVMCWEHRVHKAHNNRWCWWRGLRAKLWGSGFHFVGNKELLRV